MPNAVPRGDEIVLPGRAPFADIGVVKGPVRLPLPGERNHPRGKIQSFDFISVTSQQPHESTAASGAHIQSQPTMLAKLQRVLVLPNAILVEMRFQPPMSNGIVALGNLRRSHDFVA